MNYQFDKETENLFSVLLKNLPKGNKIFMVGGMVRDILLNKPVHDIDLSYSGSVRDFAKKVADDLAAAFFMLNEKYQTARIILKTDTGNKRWIDIVATKDLDIIKDLKSRDFTVNSIAIDLEDRTRIIDPTYGAMDLKNKTLRLSSPEAFEEDPIRVLRAIRLAVQFGWKIDLDTTKAIKNSKQNLSRISAERRRDELFRIFNLPQPDIAIRLLDHFNILKYCYPDFIKTNNSEYKDNLNHAISCIQKFTEFESLIISGSKSEGAMDLRQGELITHLKEFRPGLSNYFQKSIHQDRSLRSIFIFCYVVIVLLESGKIDFGLEPKVTTFSDNSHLIEKIVRKSVLSSAELKWIQNFFVGRRFIEEIMDTNISPSPEAAFTFYNQTKEAGISACFYSMTNSLIIDSFTLEDHHWKSSLKITQYLLDAYFNHYNDWIKPQILVNGYDIMKLLNTHDGVKIGWWLNQIKLETVKGQIQSRSDAMNFLLANSKN